MNKTNKYIFIFLAFVLILSSCTEGPVGIFASIASETDITGKATDAIKYSSPSFVTYNQSNKTFYAGIGTLWNKAQADETWTELNIDTVITALNSSRDDAHKISKLFAGSGLVQNNTLYVAFANASQGNLEGSSTDAYKYTPGLWSFDGTNWKEETAFNNILHTEGVADEDGYYSNGQYLRKVILANNIVFAITEKARSTTPSTENPSKYTIWYKNGINFEKTNIVDEAVGMPSSIIYDGTRYWIIAGKNILTASSLSTFTKLATPPDQSTSDSTKSNYFLSGICQIDSGVVVSNRYGRLFYSEDAGTTWTGTASEVNSGSLKYSLSSPLYININSDKTIIVGTNSIPRSSSDSPPENGYLEFDITGGFTSTLTSTGKHTIVANEVNFDTSLANQSVSGIEMIEYETGKYILFAMTDSYGLWSNRYGTENSPTSWTGWFRE